MAKPKGASWKQKQLHAMSYLYRTTAERWEAEGHVDDRRVYVNTYRMIVAGIRSLPAEPTLYVKNAMNEKLRKDRAMMERIAARFEQEEMVRGGAGL